MGELPGNNPEGAIGDIEKTPSPRLAQVESDLKELEVFPYQVIQSGKTYEVDRDFYNGKIFSESGRPFTVVEIVDIGEDSNEKSLIYKLGPEPGTKDYDLGANEIIFLRDIAPVIYEQFTSDLKERIILPTIQHYRIDGDRPTYLVENMFKGDLLGTIHEARADLLDENVVETIAEFIGGFSRAINEYSELAANLNLRTLSATELFTRKLEDRSRLLTEHFGSEGYEKISALLDQSRGVIDQMPAKIIAGDLNSSNIIKQEDGRLGFFDWERIERTNDPSADYTFIFMNLLHRPQLQEHFYRLAVAHNDENFPLCFRINLLCGRGAGELNYWEQLKRDTNDQDTIERADIAIGRIKEILIDALNGTGVWEDGNDLSPAGQ